MKQNKISLISAAALAMFAFGSCSDVLDETPRSTFTLDYFTTEEGIKGGLTQMYGHLRSFYANYYLAACECGTDEFTYGQSGDNNNKDNDFSGVGNFTPSTARTDVIWSPAFININTASALIEQGNASGLDASLVAEANFFRAFDYFLLVQHFGGVPLDLGSGELKSNAAPSRSSVRNTVPEVYTRCIFPDLITAVNDLPESPRLIGTATKTVARLYLAKAYLTYAWWLENPNNIPTYPVCDRVDPDGKTAAQYYQLAYDFAMEAINNPGPFGLQETFYDMCTAQNERNPEMLLWADHIANNWMYNGYTTNPSKPYAEGNANDYGSDPGANGCNNGFWFENWNYTELQMADGTSTERIDRQGYGRPWTRMAPTYNVFNETFADVKDSRRDATFQTTIHANWHIGGSDKAATHKNANNMDVEQGGIILTFVPKAIEGTVYKTENGALGLGEAPDRADWVVDPEHISRKIYPGPFKISGFSQESDDLNYTRPIASLGVPNADNVRPFYVAKFSELYLIAAEAAVKGASGEKSARDLVNVLRARAGKWNYSVAEDKAIKADYSADLVAATPATIDIKYIMLERSREFFGEGYRRLDLIRTQTWEELAGSYKICGDKVGDWTLEEFQREIKPEYYLSPIPQGQLDGLEMSAEEKAAYQNPGY
ncbi:MAG: RagB/SusD family nutrient uptake outer membrane protein [Salinivirgaceae bacterium]|nr:RagB/SusD family nutrient uptake outer membrane protein [Salinivirgaceae bacterium]